MQERPSPQSPRSSDEGSSSGSAHKSNLNVRGAGWVGKTIRDRYEVLHLIGVGGMGTVYRARDLELDETIALKVLRRDLTEIPEAVERFRREVKLARRVTHRNVARVFDIDEWGGDKFLTMELVEGEPLSAQLARSAPLPLDRAFEIAENLAEGLAAAHAAGVIHRDLKPENILLSRDGRIVITDFGIARGRHDDGDALRTFGAAVGTPAYMAPEQVEPESEIDARADIYALGAVLFELFTGARAWPGEAPIAVAAARLLHPPPDPRAVRPDLPEALGRIVLTCMARRRQDRFPSAESLASALRIVAQSLVQDAAPGRWGVPPTPRSADPFRPPSTPTLGDPLVPSTLQSASASNDPAFVPTVPPSAPGAPSSAARRAVVDIEVGAPSSAGSRSARTLVTGAGGLTASHVAEAGPERRPRPATLPPSSPSPGSVPKTVAVLPFRNLGPPDDEHLADGITDDLIDALSMTAGVRVRARGIVMPHKGTALDPREIGRLLDVELVVEGNIRRVRIPGPAPEDGVRITARITGVRDGFQHWAKRFDRPMSELFEVNDEVAGAVAEALTLDAPPPARDAPADAEAVELYLRGREQYLRYWPENVKRAAELFGRALERAPDHPTILSAYALASARLWWFGGREGAAAGQRARDVAERAVHAAPHLGEPHLALASVQWNLGDAERAAISLRAAIERAPALAEAHALVGRMLVEAGRVRDGIARLRAAAAIEPNVPLAYGELARAHALLGEHDRVQELAERAAATEGAQSLWFLRARMALWRRDRETAAAFLAQLDPSVRVLGLAKWLFEQVVHQTPPEGALDLAFFRHPDAASARRRSFVFQIEAEVRAFHGQTEAAIRNVSQSVEAGLIDLAWFDGCPLLEPLRPDDRFRADRAIVEARSQRALAALGV